MSKETTEYCQWEEIGNWGIRQPCLKIATDQFSMYDDELVYLCKEHSDKLESLDPQLIVNTYGKNWKSQVPIFPPVQKPTFFQKVKGVFTRG